MKNKVTVSLCLSKDFEIEVDDISPENLYKAFITQYKRDKGIWTVDDLEVIIND